tara:strand:- start:1925 stop:3028 length:1104 start_codon:yes stop_codon:yes gene_type:complete
MQKLLISISYLIFLAGCASNISQYTSEDVEKQRLKFLNGDKKSLELLTEIYKDNTQPYEVRMAAIRALSDSRHPMVINDIQSAVKNASLVELEIMKEAIQILIEFQDEKSIDSLIAGLNSTEKKTLEIRVSILNAIGEHGSKDEIKLILKLYDFSKRSYAQMNKIVSTTLGEIGDESVIPILMDIAKDDKLPMDVRNRSIEVLSKKNAPELVDFFVSMLGNPESRSKINEYAFDVMGEIPEERMLLALIESYKIGQNKYFSLVNTIIGSLDNFDNPQIKTIYLEIAQTKEFPSNIRLKAFRQLASYSDPEIIDGMIDLLNDPGNYIYYNDIIAILNEFDMYNLYEQKLKLAAYNAMKNEENSTIKND